MKTYLVTWRIDIEAGSPQEAAEKALDVQRSDQSIATVFDVQAHGEHDRYTIDLNEEAR